MNLVKAYDLAKSLEIPQLIPYSNGSNPEVLPPYVALAEIQAKEAKNKRLAAAQGASSGEMPSIKEKYEQAAGLMALKDQQQQQAQQQMMSQMAQAPQPAPQGVPQPEQQPQPQMMAGGGLARLPVNSRMFDYRAGGIIGFANEGEVPVADEGTNLDAVKAQAEQAIANLRKYGTIQQRQDPEGYQRAQQAVKDAQQSVQSAVKRASEAAYNANPPYIAPQKPFRNFAPKVVNAPPESGDMGARDRGRIGLPAALPKAPPQQSPQPSGDVEIPMSPELRAALEKDAAEQGITSPQFNFRGAPGSTATLTPQAAPTAAQPATQTATQPAPPQAGLATLQSGFEKSLTEGVGRAAAEQGTTPAQAKARYAELTPDELKEPAGLAQLARLKQQQEQYTKSQEDRPYERLMKVLGAAGRGGMGGFGSGYLGAVEGERAADAAQSAYQEKVMTAVEAARRGEATTKQKAMLDMVEAGDVRKAKAISDQISGASQGYQVTSTAKAAAAQDITDRRGQDLNLKAAELTAASADARATRDEKRQLLQELNVLGKQLEASIKEIDPRMALPEDKQKRVKYQQSLENVQRKIAEMGGVALVSAESTMTPPPGAVREVKK